MPSRPERLPVLLATLSGCRNIVIASGSSIARRRRARPRKWPLTALSEALPAGPASFVRHYVRLQVRPRPLGLPLFAPATTLWSTL